MNEQQKPQMIAVPQELLQATADYLSQRPFREVAGLLQALQQCAVVSPPDQPAQS